MNKITLVIGIILVATLVLISTGVAEVKSFTVKETDLVHLVPQATDLNQDQITYYYSYPLNDKGEWQTNYGDAGEYYVNITASDGKAQTTQRVLLIVQKKNRAPVFYANKISVKETQEINLKSLVSDEDKDALSYTFTAPFDKNGVWKTVYGDMGSFVTEVSVNDGTVTVKKRIEVEVLATNQEPQIVEIFNSNPQLSIKEGETLNFSVSAEDREEDKITYLWTIDGQIITNKSAGEYYFNFTTAGNHNLKLVLSDGKKDNIKEWKIVVEDVKLAPEFSLLPISVTEGEVIRLNLPERDFDNNEIAYSFSGGKFDSKGVWETEFNDSGKYMIKVVGRIATMETAREVKVTIIDKDRAPKLEVLETVNVKEGEELKLPVKAYDEDGDKLEISFANLPAGVVFKDKVLSWTPSYDTIIRNKGWLGDLLNALRIEHKLLTPINFPISITSCGKDLCTSRNVNIMVSNSNRAPQMNFTNIIIKEEELAKAQVQTFDADGDIVRLYYTSPLGKRSGKWDTEYGDEGNYSVYITATDGESSLTLPMSLEVKKNNRQPSLDVGDDKLTVNEGQQFTINVKAEDSDNDNLTIRLDNIPAGASFKDGVLLWAPSYDLVKNKTVSWWSNLISKSSYLNKRLSKDKEVVWLNFVASDGEIETMHPVKVMVKNVNRAPALWDYLPRDEVTVWMNKPVIFHVTAVDEDKEQLSYTWEFDNEKEITGTDTVKRTYTSPGIKDVRVTISDGRYEAEKSWKVKVVDVQAPEVEEVVPMVEEVKEEPFTIKVYVIEQNRTVMRG